MNTVQSYVFSAFRAPMSLLEMRIILKIVEACQPALKGVILNDVIGRKLSADGVNLNLSVRIQELIGADDHHYKACINALKTLAGKVIACQDEDKVYRVSSVIYNIEWQRGTGVISFSVAKWVVEKILDFSMGYTKYEMESAMALPSANAMRLYLMMASASRPITYSLDFLKAMLGVSDKYSQSTDFIKRCLAPAATEMEKQKLNGFSITPLKEGKKITKVLLSPVKRQTISQAAQAAQLSLNMWGDPLLMRLLLSSCQFTSRELNANKAVIFKFGQIPYWQDSIAAIIERQRRYRKTKGYIIAAMKSEVKAFEGGPA